MARRTQQIPESLYAATHELVDLLAEIDEMIVKEDTKEVGQFDPAPGRTREQTFKQWKSDIKLRLAYSKDRKRQLQLYIAEQQDHTTAILLSEAYEAMLDAVQTGVLRNQGELLTRIGTHLSSVLDTRRTTL